MIAPQTEAQLYLADQRGCSETPLLRSFHTFNFGTYRAQSREPFGALHLLNDDTLRPGASLSLRVQNPTDLLLLPVVGGLEYGYALADGFLEPGQVGVFSLTAGMEYTVSNPYETEFIQLLQLGLTRPTGDFFPAFTTIPFDLTRKNTLLSLFDTETGHASGRRVFIGRYDGRQDGALFVSNRAEGPRNGVFVFVLNGVFEVANRLLHAKDGLALPEVAGTVVFEALSNDAILLAVET